MGQKASKVTVVIIFNPLKSSLTPQILNIKYC